MLFGCAKDEAIYLDCEGTQFVIYPEKGLVDIIFDNSPYQINLETGSSYYSFQASTWKNLFEYKINRNTLLLSVETTNLIEKFKYDKVDIFQCKLIEQSQKI